MIRRSHRVPVLRIRGWAVEGRVVPEDVRDSLEGSIGAIPDSIIERLPLFVITLQPALLDPDTASRWVQTETGIRVEIATADVSPHDCALELLMCAGQVLWQRLDEKARIAWFQQLRAEIDASVAGEIDELSLREKKMLLSSRAQASSRRRLERYARQSFAGTVAEYCHALWHDVTVRNGREHLPAQWLRRRFELLMSWFPCGRELFGRNE